MGGDRGCRGVCGGSGVVRFWQAFAIVSFVPLMGRADSFVEKFAVGLTMGALWAGWKWLQKVIDHDPR